MQKYVFKNNYEAKNLEDENCLDGLVARIACLPVVQLKLVFVSVA